MAEDRRPGSVPATPAPRQIQRLPEDVVNRIAAGEVVVRPSAALKELLENSLDAGATSITVSVRSGGMKLLQVTDNGGGIGFDDLPLLCERFATSKLREFADLREVATFGFRGEALASISHVARLSVLTKTPSARVAYRAAFLNGAIKAAPVACAGVDGTSITVEDLFYNLPTRRMAVRSTSDEYRAIVDVVARYAIRYSGVSFVCKKLPDGSSSRASAGADVRTDAKSSVQDNIRAAFGAFVAQELMPVKVQLASIEASIEAYVSSANFNMKKGIFVLFINGRLVDCAPLKRAIDAAFSVYLPKGTHPFAYLSLCMQQCDIDVNVHPTKKEVRFLHEAEIIQAFIENLEERLKSTETSRTFLTQSILASDGTLSRAEQRLSANKPSSRAASQVRIESALKRDRSEARVESVSDGAGTGDDTPMGGKHARAVGGGSRYGEDQNDEDDDWEVSDGEFKEGNGDLARTPLSAARSPAFMTKRPKIAPKDKVRTGASAPLGLIDVYMTHNNEPSPAVGLQRRRRRRPNALPLLTSVQKLLDELRADCHPGIAQIFREHIFVGVASERFALIQHNTKLLLAEIEPIVTDLMYRQVLMRFADMDSFALDPPAPLLRLLQRYCESLSTSLSTPRISAESCATILIEQSQMLSEYFGLGIRGVDANQAVVDSLPIVLPGLVPDMKALAEFLYDLAVDTDWSEERACFESIAAIIADFYGKHWVPIPSEPTSGEDDDECHAKPKTFARREWLLQHVLFSSLRSDYNPPHVFGSRNVLREVTSTARLYKIFERC